MRDLLRRLATALAARPHRAPQVRAYRLGWVRAYRAAAADLRAAQAGAPRLDARATDEVARWLESRAAAWERWTDA
jgi:hypothetical protein